MKFYLFFTSGGLCFFVLCHLPSLLVQGVEISLGYLKQEILGPLTDIIYSPIFFLIGKRVLQHRFQTGSLKGELRDKKAIFVD